MIEKATTLALTLASSGGQISAKRRKEKTFWDWQKRDLARCLPGSSNFQKLRARLNTEGVRKNLRRLTTTSICSPMCSTRDQKVVKEETVKQSSTKTKASKSAGSISGLFLQ